jgi:hypothetical protein
MTSYRNNPLIEDRPLVSHEERVLGRQRENLTNHINNAFAKRPQRPPPRSILDKIKTDLGRPDIVRVGLDDKKGRWSDLSSDTNVYQNRPRGHFWDKNASMGPLNKFTWNAKHEPKVNIHPFGPQPKLKPQYPKGNQTFTHLKNGLSSVGNRIKTTFGNLRNSFTNLFGKFGKGAMKNEKRRRKGTKRLVKKHKKL